MVAFIGAPAITAGGLLLLMLAAPVLLHFWGGAPRPHPRRPAGAAAMSSGGEGDGGEKSFDPTPQRLAEARRKGDIPRSTDVAAAATYLGLLAACATAGGTAPRRRGLDAHALRRRAGPARGPDPRPRRREARRRDPRRGARGRSPPSSSPRSPPCSSASSPSRRSPSRPTSFAPELDRLSILANARRKFGRPASSSSSRASPSSPPSPPRSSYFLARDLDRMIGASTAEARRARHDADGLARRAADDHHRHRRGRRRRRPRLAALRAPAAAPDVLPGDARGEPPVRGRSRT